MAIYHLIRNLIIELEENPEREGLKETPDRVAKAWNFWTSGYGQDPSLILKTFKNENHDELVFQGQIPFFSTCEHHLAPFFGMACIGYIPNGKIVGLSKLARLLDIYARRLTIQERITTQVAATLMKHLDARGVGVVLHARHLCMESRGVQKIGTVTMTSALRGCIMDEATTRAEFMSLVTTAASGMTRP